MLTAAVSIEGCVQDDRARVGNDTCLACHDGGVASDQTAFKGSIHDFIDCEDCHGPGLLHVREGGAAGLFIKNPADVPFEEHPEVCAECHDDAVAGYKQTAHWTDEAARCFACHDVHSENAYAHIPGGPKEQFTNTDYANLCADCHGMQTLEHQISVHAEVDRITCGRCHSMHVEDTFVFNPDNNNLCMGCHGLMEFDSQRDVDIHTGLFHPVDPAGSGASRCTGCHMPAAVEEEADGDVPRHHTMRTIPPIASNEAMEEGLPAPPNSCAGTPGCHDPAVPGSGVPHDPSDPPMNRFLQQIYEVIGEV